MPSFLRAEIKISSPWEINRVFTVFTVYFIVRCAKVGPLVIYQFTYNCRQPPRNQLKLVYDLQLASWRLSLNSGWIVTCIKAYNLIKEQSHFCTFHYNTVARTLMIQSLTLLILKWESFKAKFLLKPAFPMPKIKIQDKTQI